MHRFLISLLLLLPFVANAQTEAPTALFLDKEVYLTGERLHVSLLLPDTLSRVAYLEVSDTHHTSAQAMVALTAGRGWGDVPLPASMHSGYYLLTVYTRAMRAHSPDSFPHQLIAVINPSRVSRADDIVYYPLDSLSSGAPPASLSAGAPPASLFPSTHRREQSGGGAGVTTASLTRQDLVVPAVEAQLSLRVGTPSARTATVPELEGHIVQARQVDHTSAVAQTRLVMVGRNTAIFDGQWQSDGTWLYYTHGLYGQRPALLQATDPEGHPVAMEFVSPFLNVLPQSLPQLRVYCHEDDLRRRTRSAQHEQALTDWLRGDSIGFNSMFLSAKPKYSYDLDEYIRFSTVREILIEFVRGVKRQKMGGVNQLFTYTPGTYQYSDWPSLVLLDGVPVHNVDDILDYDARLLRYVQVYADRYTFGGSIYGGVIAFTSRQGLLSNFRLSAGERLVSYAFPQDHPDVLLPPTPIAGTLYWNPSIASGSAPQIPQPTESGCYTLRWQWLDADGAPHTDTYTYNIE